MIIKVKSEPTTNHPWKSRLAEFEWDQFWQATKPTVSTMINLTKKNLKTPKQYIQIENYFVYNTWLYFTWLILKQRVSTSRVSKGEPRFPWIPGSPSHTAQTCLSLFLIFGGFVMSDFIASTVLEPLMFFWHQLKKLKMTVRIYLLPVTMIYMFSLSFSFKNPLT